MTEAKVITYLGYNEVGEDIHIVKERVKTEDGSMKDDIRVIKDFKRPFWITKPVYRTYKDKKESEFKDKVDMFKSTDSKLKFEIPRRLNDPYYSMMTDLRQLKKSPYLYGTDVDARTILKKLYLKKNNDFTTPYRIGVFDIEKDVLTNEIIIISFATYDKLRVGLLKSFASRIPNLENRVRDLYDKAIPETDFKEDIKKDMKIKVFEKEIDLIKWIFREANYANIDFLTGWNIKYDITEILDLLEEEDVDPADVFHYDKIPLKYKYFKFKPGKTKKVTEAGREIPINPEEQWHVVKSTSNFYFIDAMSAHRYVRVGGKTVPGGYSLDNILRHEDVEQKLKFDTDDSIKGVEWHIYMVKNRPLEYVIYNIWDILSILKLDQKTKDLAVSVPLLSGVSHFDVFNSGPKKLVDALFFFYLENGRVLGVKDPTEENNKILGLDGWTITLIASLVDDFGLKVIKENPSLYTNIYSYVFDADVASAYPNATRAANVSKDTTHRELIKIQGIAKELFRVQNINLMYGKTNALEYMQTMFKLPDLFEIRSAIA